MKWRERNSLVSDTFEIDEDDLKQRINGDSAEYWRKALRFYCDVKGKHLADLSTAQVSWLEVIEDKTKG